MLDYCNCICTIGNKYMIYTLGGKHYAQMFANNIQFEKAVGGSVWETYQDVENYLNHNQCNDYDIYKVDADWETDTMRVNGQTYRSLLKQAKIYEL